MTRYHLTHPEDGRFAPAFALYEQSFPIHERRTKQAQQARLGCPGYHFDLLMEGEELQGILLWWEAGPFCYVEHFAIAPQLRGTGIGTRALEQLREEGAGSFWRSTLRWMKSPAAVSVFTRRRASAPIPTTTSTHLIARAFPAMRWW